MQLEAVRAEIEYMRRQIHRQRKDIRSLERAGISTKSTEELLARMLAKVDDLCVERDRGLGNEESIPAQTRSSTDRSRGASGDRGDGCATRSSSIDAALFFSSTPAEDFFIETYRT